MSVEILADGQIGRHRSLDPDCALQCRGLTKSFGATTAVDWVGFHINPGEAYGLLGPNGAGKTTTIGMVVGLVRPDDGDVAVFGRSMRRQARAARSLLGYVPQEIALYPELTARENLRFFARLYGLPRRAARTRIDHVLDLVGLSERADDRLSTYSGGMQRRINIAAALLHEPAVLVLDEPTVGVDAQSRNAILSGLEALVAGGMSLLYTSHYMGEVERLCHRIGIIDHGRMIAEGTRTELLDRLPAAERVDLELTGDAAAAARRIELVRGVREVVVAGMTVRVSVAGRGVLMVPALLEAIAPVAVASRIQAVEPDLETLFLHLTGSTLRD